MLPKIRKVKRSAFPDILKKRGTFHSRIFSLRVLKKDLCRDKPSSFSFVVSGKILKKATERNKLKRRGYAAMRGIYEHIRPCCTCVFFAKKDAARASYREIEADIVWLLKKAAVIH